MIKVIKVRVEEIEKKSFVGVDGKVHERELVSFDNVDEKARFEDGQGLKVAFGGSFSMRLLGALRRQLGAGEQHRGWARSA